jgi:hypothetical protein
MSEHTLAFLQNFYTDVTLYVPAEPQAATAVEQTPVADAAAVANAAAAPLPPVAAVPPVKAATESALAARPTISQSLKGHSQPSAGLDRLAARPAAPVPAASPMAPVPAPVAAAPEPAAVPAVPPVMLTTFATQGSNAQGVVLLFRLPPEQFVKLPRNVFLNKMLQALGLVMADVVLINVESHLPVALVNLRRELAATQIIAFGKSLLDATIHNTQIYEPVQFPGSALSYLSSAEVDLVEYDVSLKKRLWAGLQRMFLG